MVGGSFASRRFRKREGETEEEARANARDCVVTALEGYMKAGRPLPRQGARHSGPDRVVLPSLVFLIPP
jgi:hypothetical protein